jgi:hypothetical protein
VCATPRKLLGSVDEPVLQYTCIELMDALFIDFSYMMDNPLDSFDVYIDGAFLSIYLMRDICLFISI